MTEESVAYVRPADDGDVARYLAEETLSAVAAMEGYGSGQAALRPLHELQWWCDRILTHTPPTGQSLVPLYLLSRFLDDTLDNLTGDFLYDPNTNAIREDFFRNLTAHLKELGQTGFQDARAWSRILESAIAEYVAALRRLNLHAQSLINDVLEDEK